MQQAALLQEQLQEVGLPGGEDVIALFAAYHDLLRTWNRKMNLISPADMERLVQRHFLESAGLAVAVPLPEKSSVMDLGSGAGFPGLPLKIVRPDLEMILVESRQKRAAFLSDAVRTLDLVAVEVAALRAEDMTSSYPLFDIVVSRAVADLTTLFRWAGPSLKSGGILAVLKGADIGKELAVFRKRAAAMGAAAADAVPYNPFSIPLRDSKSTLVMIKKM